MKERTTIYLPPLLKEKIEESAGVKGQTLSIWIERACQAALKLLETREQSREV